MAASSASVISSSSVPQTCWSNHEFRTRSNLIFPRPSPSSPPSSLTRFNHRTHHSVVVTLRRPPHDVAFEGSGLRRRKSRTFKHYNSLLDDRVAKAPFPGQYKCISCSRNYRRSCPNILKATPRFFLDRSAFHLSKHTIDNVPVKQVHIPRATVGPDEPHATSTSWPDGILEKQGLDIFDPEIERTGLDGFLRSELPSHPKLYRGQLKNGLRYLILPNKVPPNRFEAHMEVHVGSIDEEDDEQGIAHMIEHVAFLGSKKREKLLGTGARSNAYTDFHHTVFHIHSPTSTKDSDGDLLPFVLDALNEIAFNPKFLASRVEKERRAILSELQMMNTIEYRVDCQLLQHLHSENKLSKRFPIGLEEQIKRWHWQESTNVHGIS